MAGLSGCRDAGSSEATIVSEALIDDLIQAPGEALNIFDFQRVAEATLPPAHYGYLATGVQDNQTLLANREGFRKFQLRVRRLINVSEIDTSTEILGVTLHTPMLVAPVGSQKAFHVDGEVAVAGAARENGSHQILSTVTTSSIEDVAAALGRPVWFQLYPTTDWEVTQGLVKRANSAGCEVLVLTVDLQGGSKREELDYSIRRDPRDCSGCHGPAPDKAGAGQPRDWNQYVSRKPMFDGLDVSRVKDLVLPEMTWDFIARLRELTSMKILVKGIVNELDAQTCLDHGVDGIIVSNHGGRAEESGLSTIEVLPEISKVVAGKVPLLIDSGFRRGTDIFKALALGADAVCLGRPLMWGLAAFGQSGVSAALRILQAELEMVMRQAGTTTLAAIEPGYIQRV